MSLIVSYNVSSCGVCWRVWLLVEMGVEWVWSLRGGLGLCVYMQCHNYKKLLFAILSISSSFFSLLWIVLLAYLLY